MSETKTYKSNTSGSLSLYFALAFTVFSMGSACVVDLRHASSQKASIQHLSDTMALAAAIATEENKEERLALTLEHFQEKQQTSALRQIKMKPEIEFDDFNDEVIVTIKSQQDYMLLGIFGFGNVETEVQSVATYFSTSPERGSPIAG